MCNYQGGELHEGMENMRSSRQGPVEKAEGQGKLPDNSDADSQEALTG